MARASHTGAMSDYTVTERVHRVLEEAFAEQDWKAFREMTDPCKKRLVLLDCSNPGLGMIYEKEATCTGLVTYS